MELLTSWGISFFRM